MAKLPTFKMVITDEAEEGVQYVALVDNPAIEVNWMAFADKIKFKADTEKRIVSGALMIADLPIYRRDEVNGEYNVVFDKETIFKIVKKFFKDQNTGKVNLMHSENAQVQGVYMIESFLIDRERGINAPKGFEDLSDGSWFGSYKVDNDNIWNEFVKTGMFKGFSVEGIFRMVKEDRTDEKLISEIKEILNNIK